MYCTYVLKDWGDQHDYVGSTGNENIRYAVIENRNYRTACSRTTYLPREPLHLRAVVALERRLQTAGDHLAEVAQLAHHEAALLALRIGHG